MRKNKHKHNSSTNWLPINEYIRANELLVIDEDSGTSQILSKSQALVLAKQKDQDLVLISPVANPPVAKIISYGKYKYEQSRKAKQQKKQRRGAGEIKELRLSVRMGEHDRDQRLKRARKFLEDGYNLAISLRFQGRENIFRDRGLAVLENFAEQLNMEFTQKPRFAGNIVNVQLKKKSNHEEQNEQKQA